MTVLNNQVVEVTFGGSAATYSLYFVEADSEEAALSKGYDAACNDLAVVDARPSVQSDWCISVCFKGISNGTRSYIVPGANEQEARSNALHIAYSDLKVKLMK